MPDESSISVTSVHIDYEAEGMTACEVCGVPFTTDDMVGFDREGNFAHAACGGGQ